MPFSHSLLALLVIAFWGVNFVVIQIGLQEVPPILLTFLRFFFASFPAIFFVKRPNVSWKMLFLYGLFMFTLDFVFLFTGMYVGVSSGIASLSLQTQVFFTAFLAVYFLKESITRWQIFGGILAFSGIGLVGANTGGDVNFYGLFLVELAALSWAAGNLVSKRIGQVEMLPLVIWGSFVAWPPLLLLSLVLEGNLWNVQTLLSLSWQTIGVVAYLVYPVTLFGFAVWSWLLSRHPSSSVAPFTLLVPIFGFSSSAIILKESVPMWKVGAAILIVSGLIVGLYGKMLLDKMKK
ncbi:MAG: EamA family transporter [Sulfurospirillaceae bacterium]|nr:EamA family transporter [Sulfurospirillaceae bacterium]MDD2826586.1 EamA family transporter [Sulfurospirillaceae bacterium]